MRVIRDHASVATVHPDVRALIEQRLAELAEYADDVFAELVFFVVVEPGDTLAEVDTELGFPILADRWDGTTGGYLDFTPPWEVLEEHAECYEIVFVLCDDGSGVTVFVPKVDGVPAELLATCAAHAQTGEEAAP